jgi:8-oxo-dGTP pyrophosphatase MutT (NUDIX family)
MIRVYSADKIIYLTSLKALPAASKGSILVQVSSQNELADFYQKLLTQKEINEIYFYNADPAFLFQWFKAMFEIIEAAGGLVRNPKNEYLFIYRHNKWDLPKGKIEKGEAVKIAAIREVEEECGVSGLTIIKELRPTYHTYNLNEKAILKPTYWYEMECTQSTGIKPQLEEGITEVKWLKKEELEMVRKNTYASIEEVISGL